MRRRAAPRRLLLPLVLLALPAGCQPAGRYTERLPAAVSEPAAPLDPGLQWLDPNTTLQAGDVPLLFVHPAADRAEWERLPRFWNVPLVSLPPAAGAVLGPSPYTTDVPLVTGPLVIKLKVPLGLDDPRGYVHPANPPTLNKWQLGRRLFFDPGYLDPAGKQSCAGCHDPGRGYTDGTTAHPGSFNAPALINCLYNRHQFWDGRAVYLEEVVQRTLEDERSPSRPGPFRHVWHGVITRLRDDAGYCKDFRRFFGCDPTQDAVGRALATYLRTLLSGNSVHDRAVQSRDRRGGKDLEASDYAAVLDPAALKSLGRADADKTAVAAQLFRGYQLFAGRDPRHQTNCIACHGGHRFTDDHFHNIGVGWTPDYRRGRETGRFVTAPVGHKDGLLIGAFRTPSLRALPRTAPYMHDGSVSTLEKVVEFFNSGRHWNEFLAPELRNERDPAAMRKLNLGPVDVEALVLFLRALDGDEVDPYLLMPPPR
jgi:cytochrome c peroxidase